MELSSLTQQIAVAAASALEAADTESPAKKRTIYRVSNATD
jgi:hypothetical protein